MQKGISLKVVWYGLIVLVALAPVAILYPWLGSKAHTLLLESALSREAQFNEAIKSHVDHEVGRIITLLQNKSDPMAYTLARVVDKELLNGLLDTVINREDAVHVLILVDRRGRLIAGKDRHGRPLLGTTGSGEAGSRNEGQADREPLFDPRGPEFVIPLHGRVYTGQPFFQEGELNFHIAVPVGPPIHRPLAVLLATIDAGKLWQAVQAQLARPGVSTYLVDSRGSLLAPPAGSVRPTVTALLSHMDIVRSLIARRDWVKTDTYIGLNGLSSFGSAALIDSLNWGVISEIPESTISGPIVATLTTMTVIAAAMVVIFGVLGLWLVNQMLRPMTELSGAFDRVALGDFSQAIPSSSIKEFNTLSTGFNHMITERGRAEETVRNIAAGVSAQTGEAFFQSLVEHIAKIFSADYAFIGVLGKGDPPEINTLAVCAHGQIVDNISYSLAGTPCANVMGQSTCAYPSGVQQQFPEDPLLVDMGVEGYIGTPLFDSRGEPLGILVVLDGKPLQRVEQVGDLLEIFAARAGAELERMQAEKELQKHRDHLEELVEERTNELHTAQDELLRKERLATLGQLTATVSHELRNPLGTLRTSLYSITDKLKGKKLGVDRPLERMDRNITRCDKIIHEMLDFSRIRDLDLKPIPIDTWLTKVLAEQPAPEGITVKKNLMAAMTAQIDGERLRRAIINIFDNACQALLETREEDKRKRVVTVGTQVRNHRLEITVDDTGPGIPDTILDHIFEPLYSTKGFGVGLGLPIVKQIMEQHRGGVEVSSEEGRGTQVVLWLPLSDD